MRPEFKAGYRACLIQTGHKLTLNLILGPDLVIKNNVSVRSLASTAGVPARKRSRGGRGVPRQHSLAISARIMTHYLITYTKLRADGRNCLAVFFWTAKEQALHARWGLRRSAEALLLPTCRELADHMGKTKLRSDPCRATYVLSASGANLST